MRKPKLYTIFLCLSLFLLALLYSFPFQNLKGLLFGKIYAATKILLVADSIYPSFFGWPGIGLENVNVTLPVADTEMELFSEKMMFRVGLGGLFPPSPSISLYMKNLKKGGDLYVKVGQGQKVATAYIEAENVNLEQITPQGSGDTVFGNANINADVVYDLTELSKSSGFLDLKFDKLRLATQTVGSPDPSMAALSFAIPAMTIGSLSGRLSIKNGTVEFSNFKFGDPNADLRGSITGDIRLGKDYLQSLVSIILRIQLSPKVLDNPQAKTFVTFLQGYQTAPGDYAMKWNATIQEFTGLSIKVLPDKVPN